MDRYYVCEDCGHYWSSPFFPDDCENCRRHCLVEAADLEDAEDASEALCSCDAEGPDYFGNFDRIPNPSCPIHES